MKKYLIILTLAGLFAGKPSFGQRIRGGELWAGAQFTLISHCRALIYREGAGVPTILFDWGDGTIDTLYGQTLTSPVPGIYVDEYEGTHIYPSPGTYLISVTDSFLVKNIVNIPDSGNKYLTLRDTFVIPEDIMYNNLPGFINSQTLIVQTPNGAIIHDPFMYIVNDPFDIPTKALVPFPVEGYTFPEATDSLVCCILWDRPVQTGKYAFAIRAYDWRDGQIVSTATRAMVIDVNSVVSSVAPQLMEQTLEVYPNPVSETLHLAWLGGESTPATLTVANALGQVLLQERIDLATGGEEIDVRGWPPGLYAVQIAAGGRQVVRKVVVAR